MLVITELRLRQENCELKVSLVYKMRLYLKTYTTWPEK